MCESGEYIPEQWMCDDREDCADGSDEYQGCCTLFYVCTSVRIPSFTFLPYLHSTSDWDCSGYDSYFMHFFSCAFTSALTSDCGNGEIQCYSSGECRPRSDWCDGRAQCSDLSDELCCGMLTTMP